MSTSGRLEPPQHCPLCPRLTSFLAEQRRLEPEWHNAPVRSFGDPGARLLIVGLAPGLAGANRTGRPFTGDYAGNVLYPALARFGFSAGTFDARPDDGLRLIDCRITNAVRCVPPKNRPTGQEIRTCRRFLVDELLMPPRPQVVLVLGRIAHETVTSALALKRSQVPFGHGRTHAISGGPHLVSSYHCSRYNINTGRLTQAMFDDIIASVRALLA